MDWTWRKCLKHSAARLSNWKRSPDEKDGLRFKMLGLANQSVVVVVYTESASGNEVRLITAWRANKIEQALYYRQIFGEGF